MPPRSRVFLLVLAILLAAAVFGLGSTFTASAEASASTVGSDVFWLLLALGLASPLWLPAVLAPQSGWPRLMLHWLCAAALLVPLWLVGSVLLHQARLYPGANFSVGIFSLAAAFSVGCVAAVVVLVRPRR
jgi:hypothetical protein